MIEMNQKIERDGAETQTLSISTTPPTNAKARHAGRLLAMVHELHKAGFQRLRISPGYSADEKEWRCVLTPADNVGADGWSPIEAWRGAVYDSKDGKKFFGWEDAGNDDARRLAMKFLERYPEISRASAGRDWTYAGWLTSILGEAENVRLPALFGGLNFFYDPPRTAAPPPSAWSTTRSIEEFVSNVDLALSDLPPPNADYERLWPFCLTYDGYKGGLWESEDILFVKNSVFSKPLGKASVDALRSAAYYVQRYLKMNSELVYVAPPSETLKHYLDEIREVVEELRTRLTEAQTT